jgi:hypothetical protein
MNAPESSRQICACPLCRTWVVLSNQSLCGTGNRVGARTLFGFIVKKYVIRRPRESRFYAQNQTKRGGEISLTRQQILLALLAASQGRPYTPVQIQKAAFLITRNLPQLVNEGPNFAFEPYDYGPFDQSVYTECEQLARAGSVEIIAQNGVRWNRYAASDSGVEQGMRLLESMPQRDSEYLRNVAGWVRSQSFVGLVKAIYDQYPEMKVNSVFRG